MTHNLSAERFGRLVAIKIAHNAGVRRKWLCRCDCGNYHPVDTYKLRTGYTRSCGCLHAEGKKPRHGMSDARVYGIWMGMRKRCLNKNFHQYRDYGGRGIDICERWSLFENFYEDMGEPTTSSYTIDRVDNDKGYSPDNCRWATMKEQNRNRRNNKVITYDGKSLCLAEWEEETGIRQETLSTRLRRGWSEERALTEEA